MSADRLRSITAQRLVARKQVARRSRVLGEIIMQLGSDISAVVTGGASGLGAATATLLTARGVQVAVFDLDEEKGAGLAQSIGGLFCRVDVTSDEDVDTGFAQARAAHVQERILVNCAGTGKAGKTVSRDKVTGAVKHLPLDTFNRIILVGRG